MDATTIPIISLLNQHLGTSPRQEGGFMKSDREVLEEAIELIDNPEHWVTGSYAEDRDGEAIDPESPLAQSWCAVGALHARSTSYRQSRRIAAVVMGKLGEDGSMDLINFNDHHLHSEVILAMKQGLDNL